MQYHTAIEGCAYSGQPPLEGSHFLFCSARQSRGFSPSLSLPSKELYNHQSYKMMFWPLLSSMPIHLLCILRKSGSQGSKAQGATPTATITSLPQCSRVEEQPVYPHVSICAHTSPSVSSPPCIPEACILLQILQVSRDVNVLVSRA